MQIEKRLRDWFVDSKLSIHFGDDKKKSILFPSKRRARNIRQLNIKTKDKTALESSRSWIRLRQDDVRRVNGIKSRK